MILGMSVPLFTQMHVTISLIGIAAGVIVAFGLIANRASPQWTTVFLVTTILASATGFLFHSKAIGPPHVIGAISLVVLAVATYALYGRHLAGHWRAAYVVAALLALYFNAFVGVVQAFQNIPALHELAPNGSEPPFALAQLVVLAIFGLLGFRSLLSYRRDARAISPAARSNRSCMPPLTSCTTPLTKNVGVARS